MKAIENRNFPIYFPFVKCSCLGAFCWEKLSSFNLTMGKKLITVNNFPHNKIEGEIEGRLHRKTSGRTQIRQNNFLESFRESFPKWLRKLCIKITNDFPPTLTKRDVRFVFIIYTKFTKNSGGRRESSEHPW